MPRRPIHDALVGVLALGAMFIAPPVTHGQAVPAPAEAVRPGRPAGPSPRGAFVRAVLLPGWGHASIGSYGQAGFYFAAETGTLWALVRTDLRLNDARRRVTLREGVLRSELAAEGVTDPTAIEEGLDADPSLAGLRGLVEARRQQREDWTALGIFLLFLSGADAFVSAHLKDFPEPLSVEGGASPSGGLEMSVRVTLPR